VIHPWKPSQKLLLFELFWKNDRKTRGQVHGQDVEKLITSKTSTGKKNPGLQVRPLIVSIEANRNDET
jgi:hypothetical protein